MAETGVILLIAAFGVGGFFLGRENGAVYKYTIAETGAKACQVTELGKKTVISVYDNHTGKSSVFIGIGSPELKDE